MDYISYACSSGLSASTIITQLSAVSFLHKLAGKRDPTKSFIVKKMLTGVQHLKPAGDSRLPFKEKDIAALVESLRHGPYSVYHKALLKAMYLLAFSAFLRVGEFTLSRQKTNHVIKYQNVKFVCRNGNVAIHLSMDSYKHSLTPVTLCIVAQKSDLCPVQAMRAYLKLRGTCLGPLFIFQDNTPVSTSYFTSQLKLSVSWAGLDHNRYKGHSFRIGAATVAAERGATDNEIERMGRWKSKASKRYIRIPTLKVQ